MHIICASYNNIGPFANQTITLFLKSGKYLIKAPIGSGKSFLFFDGLVYALYGYSKRDMLNVECDSGRTKVLFVSDDKEVFLIERPLTGKKGVKLRKIATTQEKITQDLERRFDDVLTYGQDFAEYIDTDIMESFDFHRSVEIQQNIELLLPPRAVFLQRHILMQDSENIFDLQPKARIDILKLLFGLDMIDTVRDRIGEQKNELRGQYKVLTESAHITESYQSWFDSFSGVVATIQSALALCNDNALQTEFDNIGIVQFLEDPLSSNADSLKYDVHERSLTGRTSAIERLTREYTQLESEIRFLREQQVVQESVMREKKQHIAELQTTIEAYRKELHIDGPQESSGPHQDAHSVVEQLVAQKQSIAQDIARLDQSVQASHWALLQSYDLVPSHKTVSEYVHMMDKLKQFGISKKHELDTVQAKMQTHQLQQVNRGQELLAAQKQLALLKQKEYEQFVQSQEHAIGLLEKTIDELNRQHNALQEQLQTTQKTLDGLLVQSQHLSQFHCDRIQADCPFISQINAGSLSKLDAQIQQTKEQLEVIQNKIVAIRVQLQPKQEELTQLYNAKGAIQYDTFQPQHTEYQKTLRVISDLELGDNTPGDQLQTATLEQQQKRLEDQIAAIRSDYILLHDVVSAADRDRYEQLVVSGKQLEADILLAQQRVQQQQSQLQEYHTLIAQCEQITVGLVADENKYQEQNQTILYKQGLYDKPLYVQLSQLSECTKRLEQLVRNIQDLHREQKRVEEKVTFIKQQLGIATDLHSIFSKELTLYVLQSYIPVLNDYINAFLAKVVDIQLSIQIGPDGDELLLTVEDERGTREVKSLSGGQKTVLRLCWILATSVVFGNSFLLLDETINNIDNDIVGKVSELLSDYVKQHAILFYVVTHSEQIQQMTIRDGTILLSNT